MLQDYPALPESLDTKYDIGDELGRGAFSIVKKKNTYITWKKKNSKIWNPKTNKNPATTKGEKGCSKR